MKTKTSETQEPRLAGAGEDREMDVTIRLSPEQEHWLRDEAGRAGEDIETAAARLLDRCRPSARNEEARALLRSWAREDETGDAEELGQRRRDWDELRTALNAHHTSERVLFPDPDR